MVRSHQMINVPLSTNTLACVGMAYVEDNVACVYNLSLIGHHNYCLGFPDNTRYVVPRGQFPPVWPTYLHSGLNPKQYFLDDMIWLQYQVRPNQTNIPMCNKQVIKWIGYSLDNSSQVLSHLTQPTTLPSVP